VLLAAIGCILLLAIIPAPRLTICALKPTGLWIGTNDYGETKGGEVWQFGITNWGRAPASWTACIGFQRSRHENDLEVSIGIDGQWAEGFLPPGASVVTNMAAPATSSARWAGVVMYQSPPTSIESTLWPAGNRVPGLRRFFPGHSLQTYRENWHTTTNATSK